MLDPPKLIKLSYQKRRARADTMSSERHINNVLLIALRGWRPRVYFLRPGAASGGAGRSHRTYFYNSIDNFSVTLFTIFDGMRTRRRTLTYVSFSFDLSLRIWIFGIFPVNNFNHCSNKSILSMSTSMNRLNVRLSCILSVDSSMIFLIVRFFPNIYV